MVRLWSMLRAKFAADGPFLLGAWSIADAYFTPVATRFRTYGVPLTDHGDDGSCGAYAALLLEQPECLECGASGEGGGVGRIDVREFERLSLILARSG